MHGSERYSFGVVEHSLKQVFGGVPKHVIYKAEGIEEFGKINMIIREMVREGETRLQGVSYFKRYRKEEEKFEKKYSQ